MLHLGLSFKDAHTILRGLRTSAQPNEGFLQQLSAFEKETSKTKLPSSSGANGTLDSAELERKDREFLASQCDDESWLEEWSNTRRRTMSTLTPEVAKKDEVLFQKFVGSPSPGVAEGSSRSRTVSMLPSLTYSPIRPFAYPASPTGPRPQEIKRPTPPILTTLAPTPTTNEWNLPRSSLNNTRMRSATSWEIIDKHGKRDLWLPDDFVLPPPPRPPTLPNNNSMKSISPSTSSSFSFSSISSSTSSTSSQYRPSLSVASDEISSITMLQ